MKRENNIDALRVVACFMVIIIHLSSDYIVDYMQIGGTYFKWGNFYDSLSRTAVPIFVVIAGRYALTESRNMDWKNYYIKIWKKIYVPTFIWSLVYFGFFYLEIYFKGTKNWWLPVKALYEGAPYYHLWYLYMCIGLYLLTPFFINLRMKMGEKTFRKLGYMALVMGLILIIMQELFIAFDIYGQYRMLNWLKYFWYLNYFKFIDYVGYFILGYSLKDVKLSWSVGLTGTSVIVGCIYFSMEYLRSVIVYNYNLPFVLGATFLLYFTFNNANFKYNFENISKHTFNIYLVHAMIIAILNFGIRIIFKLNPSPVWYIPLATIVVFIISLMFSIGLEKILRCIK